MSNIAAQRRLVYRVLGSMGMLCARNVRGSATAISDRSWGTAIDLTIDRVLDVPRHNQIQFGLQLIAGVFNREGSFWGAELRNEDATHFEAGFALIQTW